MFSTTDAGAAQGQRPLLVGAQCNQQLVKVLHTQLAYSATGAGNVCWCFEHNWRNGNELNDMCRYSVYCSRDDRHRRTLRMLAQCASPLLATVF